MSTRRFLSFGTVAIATLLFVGPAAAQKGSVAVPRTPWGDPDLQGTYTNKYEQGTPFERPAEFEGRRSEDIPAAELAAILKERQDEVLLRTALAGGDPAGNLGGPLHWQDQFDIAKGSRAWFVVDPADGRIPQTTAESRTRAAARQTARRGRGQADSWIDRGLYDRCITRGLPGSMMPAIYGNSYDIVQGPGVVAIRYEMVHETRVIPLDGRPHAPASMRSYLGDPVGHWEGTTLVVETTNFTDKTPYRGSSEHLKMTERFTPVGPDLVEWSVTFDDPHTWTHPWTFAMNLTKVDDSQQLFEYACHEGNYGLRNILAAARAEEQASQKR